MSDISSDIDNARLIAQATTRVANVMIRKYGAGMSEETEEQANVLAVAALGDLPAALEAAEAQRDALAKAILAALNELAVKEARAAVPLINEKVRERDAALAERDALQGDVDKLVGKIGGLTGENRRLWEALDKVDMLEDALARYFADRDVPMEIRRAVDSFEIARAALAEVAPLEEQPK